MGLVLCAYGHPVDDTFRFCPHCAAPVAAALTPPKTRSAMGPPPAMPSGQLATPLAPVGGVNDTIETSPVGGLFPDLKRETSPPSSSLLPDISVLPPPGASHASAASAASTSPPGVDGLVPTGAPARPPPVSPSTGLPRTQTTLDAYYRVGRIVADGGMGRILLARERRTGRRVAIKEVAEELRDDEMVIRHFLREGIVTARLQHPGIVPVYELGFIERGDLYFSMRYIEGRSLRECSRLSRVERLFALRAAMSAVHHAHAQGLWHRDLKPDNVLLGTHGDVYVLDWGLVSVQPGARYRLRVPPIVIDGVLLSLPPDLMEVSEANPRPSGLMGTPPYMAPEQITNDEEVMGSRCDIWAFGIMLYELLTDRHPIPGWDEMTPHEIMRRVLELDEVVPSQIVGGIPPELDHLCTKMLAQDPAQRLPYLSDAMDLLSFHLRAVDPTPPAVTPTTYRGGPLHGAGSPGTPTPQDNPAAQDGYGAHGGLASHETRATAERADAATAGVSGDGPMGPPASRPSVESAPPGSLDATLLRHENERLRRRVELLTELAQLSGLEANRRAVIVGELLKG